MIDDYISAAESAKNWVKIETPYFLEYLTEQLGSREKAEAQFEILKNETKNDLELECRMSEIYDDIKNLR